MLINFPLFGENLFQKFGIQTHLGQSINESNVHMLLLKHIKKLSKLGINLGLSISLWERQGRNVRHQ